MQYDLYFGRSKPDGGLVSESEFQQFLNTEITPRFGDGLTVLNASGQYLTNQGVLIRDPSQLVILLYPNTPETTQSIKEIIDSYKQQFQQESVLLTTTPVNLEFL